MKAKPRVKICCISSLHEAHDAIASGASALGFVTSMPSGPGVVSEIVIAEIVRSVPPRIGSFLLTGATTSEAIIAQQRRCGTNTLQLCDYVEASVYRDLRRELPGIALVQVIHVTSAEAVDPARRAAEHVDALLLDSGDTTLPVKLLGGTGRTHDWAISRRIRDSVEIPIFLAGGLNAGNVAEAVAAVDPIRPGSMQRRPHPRPPGSCEAERLLRGAGLKGSIQPYRDNRAAFPYGKGAPGRI